MPQIRLLTADNASDWRRLRLESLQNDPTAFSSSAEDHHSLSEEEVRKRLNSDQREFFVVSAFDDSRLIGMSGFHREPGAKSRHKARVWGVYVTSELRGQGVGRSLMRTLLDRAAGIDGIEQILISVTATQTAAGSLYRSLGFETFGREPRALKIADRYVDEEHMILHLSRSTPA
jgi:ribosomal protein S18 acetylase RimI-like enzyme